MFSVKWGAVFFCISVLLAVFPSCEGDEKVSANTPTPESVLWKLVADPPELLRITEMEPNYVNLSLTYTESEKPSYVTNETIFLIKISMSNILTVVLNTYEIEFTWEDVEDGNNKTLQVTGQVIGYVDLNFAMDIIPKSGSVAVNKDIAILPEKYLITVVRASDTLDNVFTM